jgi:hypothetical protein
VTVPDFWLPLSLDRLVHPERNLLHDRDDLCCRVFGRLAPGVNMTQGQAEATLLASHLRTLHDPHSDLSKDVTAFITPGSPFPGKMNPGLRVTILLIMIAAGMVPSLALMLPACNWPAQQPVSKNWAYVCHWEPAARA